MEQKNLNLHRRTRTPPNSNPHTQEDKAPVGQWISRVLEEGSQPKPAKKNDTRNEIREESKYMNKKANLPIGTIKNFA